MAGPQDRTRRLTTFKRLCPYLRSVASRYARTIEQNKRHLKAFGNEEIKGFNRLIII